jgi:predicted RNase H-like HicB family nuclease
MKHTSTVRLSVEPLEEGGFLARSPDVPGLVAQASTVEETVDLARKLIGDLIAFWRDEGVPLPPALASGVGARKIELLIPVGVEDGR